MPDNNKEIMNCLTEIRVDLAVVKTDTKNIKEDTSETKEGIKLLEGRTSALERWQSKILGGLGILAALGGAMAYFK